MKESAGRADSWEQSKCHTAGRGCMEGVCGGGDSEVRLAGGEYRRRVLESSRCVLQIQRGASKVRLRGAVEKGTTRQGCEDLHAPWWGQTGARPQGAHCWAGQVGEDGG